MIIPQTERRGEMGKAERPQKVSERDLPLGFKLHYYTILDVKMRPRAMVCLATYDGTVARGISICSLKEFLEGGFKEEDGRKKARRRALKAWNMRKPVRETNRAEAWNAIKEIPVKNIGVKSANDQFEFFRYKGVYGVKPTAVEKRAFGV